MLEQMRRSSQSLLIYVLFGIVIAVFIINFGPQSQGGCDGGMSDAMSTAAKVDGKTLTSQEFKYGYLLFGGGQRPAQVAKQQRLKETIMDKLIERELLAREAERMGFRVSEEEAEDMIGTSKIISLGIEQTLPMVQKDDRFDYELFRRFVLYQLGMSPKAFIDEQRREMMAQRVRQVLRGAATVSEDEVKTDFIRRGHQVNVEYVRFPTRRYEAQSEPTEKEVEAFAKANETRLKDLYTQRKFLYEKAPKERKLRVILVKVDTGASPDAEAAAKKKAEGLLARIQKGEAFAAVARAASDDVLSKGRGGSLGWRRQGTTALGPGVEEKVWAAKDGQVLGPEKAADGWHLVVAEGTREGDLPFDKVKLELAEDQLRQDKSKALAKADAEVALAKAKAQTGKTLKDLFPAPSDAAKDGETDKDKKPKVAKAPPSPLAIPAEDAPQAEETGLYMRKGAMVPGIGPSPELAKTTFTLTNESPFAGPIEAAGAYFVVKLKERKQPDLAEFDKKKVELVREAAMIKGEEVVEEWALRRCTEVKSADRIRVNKDLLRYETGPEGASAYEPCTPPMRF
jgi:peptidyl-prolyl cis-trans isomerase D